MRKLSKVAFAAVCAAGLAGSALAAAHSTHLIAVRLPDGSTAQVEYAGDIPPRVTVAPVATVPRILLPAGLGMPALDGMFAQMDREMTAAMRQIDALSRQPLTGGPAGASLASYGSVPAGTTSYSSVTVNENGRQCTRSTQVIGQGSGKPPKVLSNVTGDCGSGSQGAPATPTPSGPIHQS